MRGRTLFYEGKRRGGDDASVASFHGSREGNRRWSRAAALSREVVASPSAGGGRRPESAGVGLSALGPKANGAGFGGRQKKMEAGTRAWAEIKE
jgi:hypothetical protein